MILVNGSAAAIGFLAFDHIPPLGVAGLVCGSAVVSVGCALRADSLHRQRLMAEGACTSLLHPDDSEQGAAREYAPRE